MQYLSDRPAGPSGGRVECTACGKTLDPLRAGHVAIFNSQFHFFCDRAVCRARFVGKTEIVKLEPTPAPTPVRRDLDAVLPPVRAAVSSSHETEVPERLAIDDPADLTEPIESLILEPPIAEVEGERRDVGALLVALTLIAGVLTMALELAGPTRLVQAARVVLLAVGTAALFGRAFTSTSDPSKPHRLVTSLAPLAATALAGASLLAGRVALTAQATFLAGTVLTVAAVNLWLVGAAERRVDKSRRWLMQRLNVPGRRVTGEVTAISPKEVSFDLRPSEHLVVEAGESVPVDLVIVEGEVEVLPCVGPPMRVRRQPGDPVVAGSRVVHGHLRGVCTWAGDERALARPMLAAARRADVHADLPRLARRLAERWAVVVTVIAAIGAVLLGHRLSDVSLAVVAVYAAFGNVAVGSLAALAVALGVDAALRRGVVYNTADGWEKCSRVTAAVFCARGTLLKGEPELVEIEVFERGQRGASASSASSSLRASAEHVLALAAGALAAERNPVAVALRRAARDRGLAAAPVRNTRSHAGFGVVAVGQSGEAVCVGSRALLLERKISVAVAEQKIYELETSGRTVVLVARAGRLLGLCA
ncbi:MAG TPA: hypothetical protein VFB62_08765, partial [Polyangiaceae bacterium]|nr:hypothetical protein [Polyangiaceae bacterium]